MRLPRSSARTVRRLAVADVVVNAGIVVTGAAVRLTGSGLGCPEWPRCTSDSLVVEADAGLHGYLEFGNRTLTGVVGLVALAALAAALLHRPRRRDLVVPAALVVLGVVVQVVLGGITVLTALHPLIVAAHFLVSMAMLAAAVLLLDRSGRPPGPVRPGVPVPLLWLGRALVATAAVVLVLGTLVTGTGPHSGDRFSQRLGFDPLLISQAHADAVFLFLGLAAAFVVSVRAVDAPAAARRRSLLLVGVVVVQASIGYTQYFTGLPILLVGLHVLGACLVWITVLLVHRGLLVTVPAAASPREPEHARAPVTV